jgi:hypothetical protein
MSFTVVRFARFRLGIVPLISWRENTASTALPKTDRRPCPGISEIAVPELLKSLSATYRNPVREFPKHAQRTTICGQLAGEPHVKSRKAALRLIAPTTEIEQLGATAGEGCESLRFPTPGLRGWQLFQITRAYESAG